MRRLLVLLCCFALLLSVGVYAQELVGKRPYEMDWAGRVENEDPPLVDFEQMEGWKTVTENAVAEFTQSREQQIWGKYVGKLTYRGTGTFPKVSLIPPSPITINEPFDVVSCWIYGNNWSYAPVRGQPSPTIHAVFEDSSGEEFSIGLITVGWKEWFLVCRRLSPENIVRTQKPTRFLRFEITNGTNAEDMVLYFDNFSVFTEKLAPLSFAPRKKRGVDMFEGQPTGTNIGPGRLPFPTSEKTILPDNLEKDFTNRITKSGNSFIFVYSGKDGKLTYTLTPKRGDFSDVVAEWLGRRGGIRPCDGGGIRLTDEILEEQQRTMLGTPQLKGDVVSVRYRVSAAGKTTEVTYRYRIWRKSLVIDTIALGGKVKQVRYGSALGLDNPRLVVNPYYHYGITRPAVAVFGPPEKSLFLTGNTDWYRSNASVPFAVNKITGGRVEYQGGVRYTAKTDGKLNDVFERFFVTISPHYEEMLPNLSNPKSQWTKVTGTGVWKAHGVGVREHDAKFWTNVWRWGMRNVIVTDHETGWRDGGESFTFRTRTAPGKGGDKNQYDYARLMQDKLGFVYGPYNNFTDFAPVNEFWSYDIVSRDPNNQFMTAWARCYAPKPAAAVEYCEKLAPEIQRKFRFSTAYCDVHTAVAPWERVDYDSRVPGAGTFAATFYSYGEIMLLQKAAWNGPVYSEGNFHFFYTGLTDGNYSQDRTYDIPNQPWLVDIDLKKMHDLGCNFGMGAPSMFYNEEASPPKTSAVKTKKDTDAYLDRFFAATIAFGHPGFLTFEGGFQNALRSYYMLQQLHADYTQVPVSQIQYMDKNGKLLNTSQAVATDAYRRNQIVTRYANGTMTVVNGNPSERMRALGLDLPPNGYAGWTKDKRVFVQSSDDPFTGKRADYAVTPEYLYVDGRGEFTRFEKAASDGPGICRILEDGNYEILAYRGASCGFAIEADKAVALNEAGDEIGTADLRRARGLLYVVPVNDAFSYILSKSTDTARQPELTSERDTVTPGEQIIVKGTKTHTIEIPTSAQAGDRLWYELESSWIDFTVTSLIDIKQELADDILRITFVSHAPKTMEYTLKIDGLPAKSVSAKPEETVDVEFDLGRPTEVEHERLGVQISYEGNKINLTYPIKVSYEPQKLMDMPTDYTSFMQLRGKTPTSNITTDSGALVVNRVNKCGDIAKEGIFMHPPYLLGPGRVFVDFASFPVAEGTAFRGSVGKVDLSYLGDGILFKVAVVEKDGKEHVLATQKVLTHEWVDIEADLSAWAGKHVTLRLISDVGEEDDSEGDWACWADMRIETKEFDFIRKLVDEEMVLKIDPSPKPVTGYSIGDLKTATGGRLYFRGMGLDSGGSLPSYAIINGVNIGRMPSSLGAEGTLNWGKEASMPLGKEAIATLEKMNLFELDNTARDFFKVKGFRLELDMPDGKTISSAITETVYSQPPSWPYSEGVLVEFGTNISSQIWFEFD